MRTVELMRDEKFVVVPYFVKSVALLPSCGVFATYA